MADPAVTAERRVDGIRRIEQQGVGPTSMAVRGQHHRRRSGGITRGEDRGHIGGRDRGQVGRQEQQPNPGGYPRASWNAGLSPRDRWSRGVPRRPRQRQGPPGPVRRRQPRSRRARRALPQRSAGACPSTRSRRSSASSTAPRRDFALSSARTGRRRLSSASMPAWSREGEREQVHEADPSAPGGHARGAAARPAASSATDGQRRTATSSPRPIGTTSPRAAVAERGLAERGEVAGVRRQVIGDQQAARRSASIAGSSARR